MDGATLNGQLILPTGSTFDVGIPAPLPFADNNDAPVSPVAADVTVTQGFVNYGQIGIYNLSAGGTLNVTKGVLQNASDGTIISGTGAYSLGNGNTINANLNNQGTIKIVAADLTINAAASSSTFTVTNEADSTIDLGAGQTLTVGGKSLTDDGAISSKATPSPTSLWLP